MEIEYDHHKDALNLSKHGISLYEATRFDWGTARITQDVRFDYGEPRFQATGYIGMRLYRMIFCLRGDKTRVISLRKANPREMKHYANA